MTFDRTKSIGGTDISAILGMNPYKTALDVFCEKRGLVDPQQETRIMRLGKRMEPVLLGEYEIETGKNATPWQSHIVHPDIEILTGTPDAIVVSEPVGVELKTAGIRQAERWGETGTDAIPEEYLLQCCWYMGLTDFDLWDVAVLIGGQDFRVYHITRNRELEEMMREAAIKFWRDHVLTGIAPELDGSESARRYVEAAYKRNAVPLRPALPTEIPVLTALAQARQARIAAEATEQQYETLVKAAIADTDGIEWGGGKVTWKTTKEVSRTEWKAVAEALHPPQELVKLHTKTGPGARRFLVRLKGDEDE